MTIPEQILNWRAVSGLRILDEEFLNFCKSNNYSAYEFLITYRQDNNCVVGAELSDNLIVVARLFENFIGSKLDINFVLDKFKTDASAYCMVYSFKQELVIKRAKAWLRQHEVTTSFNVLNSWLNSKVTLTEYAIAKQYHKWLATNDTENLDKLTQWSIVASEHFAWSCLYIPAKVDFDCYFATKTLRAKAGYQYQVANNFRPRDGFALTDHGMNQAEVADQVRYCVYCHDNAGDFCSIGFPQKKQHPELGFKINPLGVELTGCPLEQKISESHLLQKEGRTLAALLMIMRDNPLCALTGSRICNDCMQSCIYQKKEPVNIPQIETRILKDVLHLPWGLELYDLMMRYNPLKSHDYIMQEQSNRNIMIIGMGAAGMTAAHYLTQQGHNVVGVDGIKIEPLPSELVNACVKSIDDWLHLLPQQDNYGFGGVSAYGITARWNKVFLKIIYALLLRRKNFRVYGNMRFGGSIRLNDLWGMGFDHAVIAVGAGLPRALKFENSLAPGMLQANDFLMNLHLNNAASLDALMSTDIMLPVCVIGGGLTAVDAATEVQAYYIRQVERIYNRYQLFKRHNQVEPDLSLENKTKLAIFLAHGAAVIAERKAALDAGRKVSFIDLLAEWGGVSIVYRRRMQDSPAYRLNYHELKCAMAEGVRYVAMQAPHKVLVDACGRVSALQTRAYVLLQDKLMPTEDYYDLPARTIITATGATPNVAYSYEHEGELERAQGRYQAFDLQQQDLVADAEQGMFTSYKDALHRVTFIGDVNPSFQGSIVKAIASAKKVIPDINKALQLIAAHTCDGFLEKLDNKIFATINSLEFMCDYIKLNILAPHIVLQHKPAAFYRIQLFATNSNALIIEPYAAIGIKADAGCLEFIVAKNEIFYNQLLTAKVGDAIALMGPTGVACKYVADRVIWIIGKLDAARYAIALASSNKNASGMIVFINTAAAPDLAVLYPLLQQHGVTMIMASEMDAKYIDAAMLKNKSTENIIGLPNEIFIVETACVAKNLYNEFKYGKYRELIATNTTLRVATLVPMQCMLKGVCAKCLQWQVNPATGERTKAVYACSWQLQPAELVDFSHLHSRQNEESVDFILGKLWLGLTS